MAGFVDKFKRMWDAPDDEYEIDEYEYGEDDFDDAPAPAPRASRQSASASARPRQQERYSSYNIPDAPKSSAAGNKVVNIHATTKLQVVLFKPQRFDDETRSIADELMQTNTVVLNLEDTNKDMSRRIIDFLSGVAYANHGKIKKVSSSTFIIIPNNVDLTGDDLLDELENNGVYI